MQINKPEVLTEVTERFLQYENAINTNDIEVLDGSFFDSVNTIRFGMNEELWSYDEIKAFRRTRNTTGTPRELARYDITTYGDSLAVANAAFRRKGVDKIGRQSQTWVKLEGAWKVVAAHVSLVNTRQDPNPSGAS